MASKLLNLAALSSLAILACSFGPEQVAALSTGNLHHNSRHVAHEAIAHKQKRAPIKRCKPKPAAPAEPPKAPVQNVQVPPPPPVSTPPADNKPPAQEPPKENPPASQQPPSNPPSNPDPPKPPPQSAPSNGKKLLIASGMGPNDPALKQFLTGTVGFYYNWDSAGRPGALDGTGIQFLPMLWDASDAKLQKFHQNIGSLPPTIILGYNECNEPAGQCRTDPQTGGRIWRDQINQYRAKGWKTCLPATSSRPNGVQWTKDFLAACGDSCKFDCQAVHWYDTSLDKFKAYLKLQHDNFGLPLLITEYALQNFNNDGKGQATMDQIWEFTTQAVPFLENNPDVLGYGPFGVMNQLPDINQLNKLVNNNQMTDLGRYYFNRN